MEIEKMIKENLGTIVDVRTEAEFAQGHAKDSINIPLHQIVQQMDKISKLKKPLILCCASGNRSLQAMDFLSISGVECFDGGSWLEVQQFQN